MKFRRLYEAFDNEDVFVNENEPIPADAGIDKEQLEEGGASWQRQKAWEEALEDIAIALENGDLTDKQRDRLLKAEKKYQAKFEKQRKYEADHLEKHADQETSILSLLKKPQHSFAESLDSDEAKIQRYEVDLAELYRYMSATTNQQYLEGTITAKQYAEFLRDMYNALDAITMPADRVVEEVSTEAEVEPVVEAAEGKRQFKPHTIRLLKLIGSDLVEGIEESEQEDKTPLEEECKSEDCPEEENKEELEADIDPTIDDDYDIDDKTSVEAQWDEYDDDYSMDPVEQDRAHAALYGGDKEYCECGEKLQHDEWGSFCPVCNPQIDD